jgi:precorrin-2 dehydrogenase/sirohydrochlorin ferrochelatase
MTKVSDAYSWEEMSQLTEDDMDVLLRYYPENKVPTFDEIRVAQGFPEQQRLDLFDGSFGFSVGA